MSGAEQKEDACNEIVGRHQLRGQPRHYGDEEGEGGGVEHVHLDVALPLAEEEPHEERDDAERYQQPVPVNSEEAGDEGHIEQEEG